MENLAHGIHPAGHKMYVPSIFIPSAAETGYPEPMTRIVQPADSIVHVYYFDPFPSIASYLLASDAVLNYPADEVVRDISRQRKLY